MPLGLPPNCARHATRQIGRGEPDYRSRCEKLGISGREDRVGVGDEPCRSQVHGVVGTEADWLRQASGLPNESFGDLDRVELIVDFPERAHRFPKSPCVEPTSAPSHRQGSSAFRVDQPRRQDPLGDDDLVALLDASETVAQPFSQRCHVDLHSQSVHEGSGNVSRRSRTRKLRTH